jgi:type I restriction enzyme M protein
MQVNPKINKIFSAPEVKHGLSLFGQEELDLIESLIIEKDGRYFIKCQIKDKYRPAKPEEIIRQLFVHKLVREYGYPKERIDIERVVYFGQKESGLADIAVLHDDITHPYIIFEVKRPRRSDGLEQLRSYCNAEGAPIGVWSNGNEMVRLHREEPNIFVEIPRIPRASETLKDVLTERWNIIWLETNDELKKGKTTLKKIILDLEELVLGNAGVDPFDEIFKLIYAKLYDEWKAINDVNLERARSSFPSDVEKAYSDPEYLKNLPVTHPLRNLYPLEFSVRGRSPPEIKDSIMNLLDAAKRQWPGVFEPTDKIELRDDHLKICVSFLEKIKLFNSNLRIIDEAFEYLIPQVSKKKEGQFFTPRPVVDMVVKMLNPKPHEFVIDPACGSAGFLLHSVMWIAGGVITGRELPPVAKNFAQNNIMGIDFAKKAVIIAKAINLIVGDGKAHIYKDNALAPHTWSDETKAGLRARLLRFPNDPEKDKENQEKFLLFDFDILMTNPPFAGTVKEREILKLYELGEKNGRLVNEIGRHILFLNRSLQLIRPGGRMAIVLPQGLLNNTNTEHIRRFIINNARILAVVGLHANTFKPHTGTKTSVLFLQKYTDEDKKKIQEARARYEGEWEDYIVKLTRKYQGISWDKPVDEREVPEELLSFIQTYFETREELEDEQLDQVETENSEEGETDNGEETKRKKPFRYLIEEMQELQRLLTEKQEDLKNESLNNRKKQLKKEVRILKKQFERLRREATERTLGGQIYLVLNDERIKEQFKKFWLDSKLIKEMDYPIFFAVNQRPLKDESGEYRYKRGSNGELLLDEHGHPMIDHDLDEIAEAFIGFAKEQGFNFWR